MEQRLGRQLMKKLDVFDQWCLYRIVRIPWWARISNEEARRPRSTDWLYHSLSRLNRRPTSRPNLVMLS